MRWSKWTSERTQFRYTFSYLTRKPSNFRQLSINAITGQAQPQHTHTHSEARTHRLTQWTFSRSLRVSLSLGQSRSRSSFHVWERYSNTCTNAGCGCVERWFQATLIQCYLATLLPCSTAASHRSPPMLPHYCPSVQLSVCFKPPQRQQLK